MPTLLVDVDGVLLNWRDGFADWATYHGFIDKDKWSPNEYTFDQALLVDKSIIKPLMNVYNESYHIGRLPPITGAVAAVRKLSDAGFTIKAITAFSDQFESISLRKTNLINVFGHVFQEIAAVAIGQGKLDWLSRQPADSYFVEDMYKHVDEGIRAGLDPKRIFVIPQPWNADVHQMRVAFPDISNSVVARVGWNQIVNTIMEGAAV